ncbi:hypothetical protein ACMD2_06286 [Ananas comosus]|uniref:Uncharacterized protein n=1 Tax=Ananas comosus TaxID=4615 RepID=A0A199W3T0_ANACO|nr:hypothetical protein ACMD2_06286 [Ananas comosus]
MEDLCHKSAKYGINLRLLEAAEQGGEVREAALSPAVLQPPVQKIGGAKTVPTVSDQIPQAPTVSQNGTISITPKVPPKQRQTHAVATAECHVHVVCDCNVAAM